MPRAAANALAMPRSGIREIMDLAWATPGCIHLQVGEPSFATPPHIVAAAAEAGAAGWTKYVPNAGIPELRSAIADKIRRVNRFEADAEQVIVTNGGMGALFAGMLAVGEPGDGVLLPNPGWPNFGMVAELRQLRARFYRLNAEEGFLPTVAELRRAADAGTRLLVLNSPSNPLGTITPAERLAEIMEFAEQRDLWVISDECYDAITFDDSFASTAAVGGPQRVITVGTFSKTYAMTGMRVGYAVVPGELAPVLTKLQEPITACVNAMAQRAALAALTGPQDSIAEAVAAYRKRRDAAAAALDEAGIRYVLPSGAFYLWVDTSAWGPDSHAFALHLLSEHGVAVAPGTAFGDAGAGWVRLSLATELDPLLTGIGRIAAALESPRYGSTSG